MTTGAREQEADLFPIPKAAICNNSVTGFDLYVQLGGRFVLYKSGTVPFDNGRLLRHNIDTLYISSSDRAAFEGYLERHVDVIMQDPSLKPGEKAGILYHLASEALATLFENPADAETVQRVRDITAVTVDQIVRHRSVLGSFIRLASHDERTYTHSVNVCAYATALGARIRVFSEAELQVLGLAGVLHDIGKARIDDETLRKDGGLSPVEWEMMYRHPEWSAEALREQGLLPEYGIRAVLEHHESLDGSGYPRGLRGDEISLMGRIMRIADVYDAMTGRRPHRTAMSPFAALSTMRYRMTGQFDSDLLAEFVLMLGGVDAVDAAGAGGDARPSGLLTAFLREP